MPALPRTENSHEYCRRIREAARGGIGRSSGKPARPDHQHDAPRRGEAASRRTHPLPRRRVAQGNGDVRQEHHEDDQSGDLFDRHDDVAAVGRDHAQRRLPEAGRLVAGHASPRDELRDRRPTQDPRHEHLEAGAVQGSGQGRRVRSEPDLQEDLRSRVWLSGRRALRRHDRRLRILESPRRHRPARQDVADISRWFLPVRLRSLAETAWHGQLL